MTTDLATLDDDDAPCSVPLCRHYTVVNDCTTCPALCNCGDRCDEHAETNGLSGACSPADGSVCECVEYTRVIAL